MAVGSGLTRTGAELVLQGFNKFMSDLGKADKQLTGFGKDAGKGVTGLKGQFTTVLGQLTKIGAAAGVAGGLIAGGLGYAAVRQITATIDAASQLEQQIADIGAVARITSEEGLAELQDIIIDLAKNKELKVNFEEASEAIELLAKGGIGLEAGLREVADATVALANATGSDFAAAAEVAIQLMGTYGRDLRDIEDDTERAAATTEFLSGAMDGVVGAINRSKFDIRDYQLFLANASGIAEQFGVTLEDFNTVVTAISSSFYSGRDAGTSFKQMLLRLSAPTKEMQELMERYGISLFDANGEMKSMAEFIEELERVFGSIGEEIQINTIPLTDDIIKGWEKANEKLPALTKTIENQKEQLRIYARELGDIVAEEGEHSLAADKKRLQMEKLEVQLDKNIDKQFDYNAAIGEYESASGEATTATQKLTEEQAAYIAKVLGGADASRALFALARTGADDFRNLSEQVNDSGQAAESAAQRVDTLQGQWEIFQDILEATRIEIGLGVIPVLKDLVKNALIPLAESFAEDVTPAVERFKNLAETIITPISNAIGRFLEFGFAIDGLKNLIGGLIGAIAGVALLLGGALLISGILAAAAAIGSLTGVTIGLIAAAAAVGAAIGSNFLGIRDIIVAVVDVIIAGWTAVWTEAQEMWARLQPTLQNFYDFMRVIFDQVSIILEETRQIWAETFQIIAEILAEFGIEWQYLVQLLVIAFAGFVIGVGLAIATLVVLFATTAKTVAEFVQNVIDSIRRIIEGFQEMVATGATWEQRFAGFLKFIGGLWDLTFGNMLKAVQTFIETLHRFAHRVVPDAMNQFDSRMNRSFNHLHNIITSASNRLNSLMSTANNVINRIRHAISLGGQIGGGWWGYQHGTGGILTVPSGYPNDSFLAGLTSGEEFAVAPRGQSLTDMLMPELARNALNFPGATSTRNVEVHINNYVNNEIDWAVMDARIRRVASEAFR